MVPAPATPPPAGTAALITGGAGGLGLAVARRLDEAGYHTVLFDRDLGALAEAVADFERAPTALAVDVTDRGAVEAAVARVSREVGPPRVLVNAAGIAASAPLLPPDDDLWARTLAVNVTGAWIVTTACLPPMRAARNGFVCNVASTAALEGFRYTAAYVTSKHALLGLTRALAADLEGRGVRVCAVCPGFLDTPMTARTIANMVARAGMTATEARASLAAMNGSGRLIDPREVAQAVVRLLDDASSHGEILRLD